MAQLTLEEQKELRKQAVSEIEEVCGSCTLIIENRKKYGNKAAYNYCVRECQVGKRLQEIGKQLLGAREDDENDDEYLED